MEEDIKILEQFKEFLISIRIPSCNFEKEIHAIENLINRVKELEEENKSYRCQLNSAFDRGFIPESKIREKIEELDKMMDKINQGELQNYTVGELLSFKAIYKELLGG